MITRLLLLVCVVAFLPSCTVREVQTGGVAEFFMDGLRLYHEPSPIAPDPAVLPFSDRSGLISMRLRTDPEDPEATGSQSKPSSKRR